MREREVDIAATLDALVPRRAEARADEYLGDLRFRVQPALEHVKAHHAYARGARGSGVRIGIEDDGVDILSPEFRGRIRHEGASLTHWRPLAFLAGEDDFRECQPPSGECQVFEIDTSGNSDNPHEKIQDYARWIVETEGFPRSNDTWFIRDTGRSGFYAWYEIPALYERISRRGGDGWRDSHGTWVASVAAGWLFGVAPGAEIVPLARGFEAGEQREVFLAADVARAVPPLSDQSDEEEAGLWHEHYARYDILNKSFTSANLQRERAGSPLEWEAFTQQDQRPEDRTVIVHSAGNAFDGITPEELGIPKPSARLPFHEPSVRGHVLAVVGVEDDFRTLGTDLVISPVSHRCGELPADWNAAHGRHYCLAAPWEVNAFNPDVDLSGIQPDDVVRGIRGTSFAAPMVSGGIALVMDHFRGQVSGQQVALRVVDTADNTGIYADSLIYGAGLMDLEAATRPIGAVQTGTQARQAAVAQTWTELPAAYGAKEALLRRIEVAGFDERGAPFWFPASSLVGSSPSADLSPLPVPGERPAWERDAILPGLRWTEAVPEGGEGGATGRLGLRMAVLDDAESAGSSFAAGPALGASVEIPAGLRLGLLAETRAGLGASSSGAFGASKGSRLAWVSQEREWGLDPSGRWRGGLSWLLAAGRPLQEDGSMLEVGASLFSSASLSLERVSGEGGEVRTRLSAEQPLRAETGEGTLRHPVGRTREGIWIHGQTDFPLAPDAREIRLRLRHDRPLGPGDLVLEAMRVSDAGHVRGRDRLQFGVGWRIRW